MPTHIKPSELVQLIDREYPASKEEDETNKPTNFHIEPGIHGAMLRTVLDVVDSLFESQLPLDREHMFNLYLGANEIRHCLEQWSGSLGSRTQSIELKGSRRTKNLNPLTLVRRALMECFDQPIPDWVDKLSFVADKTPCWRSTRWW